MDIKPVRSYLPPSDVEIVVYHKDCHDGETAAFCAWKSLGNKLEFIPMHHKYAVNPDLFANKNVLVVDFSWPKETLALVRQVAKKVMILDHHKTAMEDLKGVEGCFFCMEESGASLAWYYFFDEPLPWLIKYVKDRDLWKYEYRDRSEPMFYGLKELGFSFRELGQYLIPQNLENLISFGKEVMIEQQGFIQEKSREAKKCSIKLGDETYEIMSLELKKPRLISEISENLYLNNQVDFTLCWFRDKYSTPFPKWLQSFEHWKLVGWFIKKWYGPQTFILSFRTNNDSVDLGDIVRFFGGGGHAKAAGAQIDYHPKRIMKVLPK